MQYALKLQYLLFPGKCSRLYEMGNLSNTSQQLAHGPVPLGYGIGEKMRVDILSEPGLQVVEI